MSDQSIQLPLPLPEAVQPWLTLNLEFHVIICHSTGCKGALTPRASSSRFDSSWLNILSSGSGSMIIKQSHYHLTRLCHCLGYQF
ncbi:hypothetical protein OIDMADRAFT_61801 [Oidiodendron maius Zn]|uniref:Uncharacterized protein n=1 Tax=Oidiodendron maius (strain Zn) TaxID=913774 RepID=A0A0C3GRT7_OIDMZ|nr:hypothetical protein OIDMADRAFT_61801 [Oidiodendron maius Zn]